MKKFCVTIICLFLISNPFLQSQDLDELYFGTDETFEVMTWNIEWFPKNNQITVDYVTQIIQALDIDLLAIQEVDDIDMFDQMLNGLPEYTGYLESAWFAGLAYIYKTDVIEINDIYEIYTTSPYWSAFPRSPMVMDLNFMGENLFIINNHFKCCGDGIMNLDDLGDEETRRYTASNLLKEYIDTNLSNKNVIVLGDLNDILTDVLANNVFQMIINDTENYLFADMEIAEGSSADWSYPWWPSHIDHILITNELFDELDNGGSAVQTMKIDDYMDGGFDDYYENISDHRPVALKLDFGTSINGDVNQDGDVNILDVVSTVNIVLSSEYNNLADFNNDGAQNILKRIQKENSSESLGILGVNIGKNFDTMSFFEDYKILLKIFYKDSNYITLNVSSPNTPGLRELQEKDNLDQLVKSILLDKSYGTYQGKIYVDKDAQKTNGFQLSKALVLSENSAFNSKPELEIYADDVKCSHGSTTGNIDQNSIFYLMSRGLSKEQANKMLVEGFLNEAIETITEPNIQSLISKLFIDKINKTKFEINEH